MKPLLILALGVALGTGACGTMTSDAVETSSDATDGSFGTVDTSSSDPTTTSPETTETPLGAGNDAAPDASAQAASASAVPVLPVYSDVTIPSGTWLPLALTSPVGSDTSAVEDVVTAELTQAITIHGRDVLPAGAQLAGVVTGVDGSGRVTGRAMVAFRFTSLRTGDQLYDVEAAPLLQLAPATKWEDATREGIGTGTGVLIGRLLVGVDSVADGVADGAAAGGGAGAAVVLATKGSEVRLEPGADASTELIAPLTVRAPAN